MWTKARRETEEEIGKKQEQEKEQSRNISGLTSVP